MQLSRPFRLVGKHRWHESTGSGRPIGRLAQFVRHSADVFFDPEREVSGITETALAGDVADAIVGLLKQEGGLLQARLRDALHDRYAGVAVESSAEGAAVVLEFCGNALGGEIGIGQAFLDEMANLAGERRDGLWRESVDDVVLEVDCGFAGTAAAGDGLVLKRRDKALDFVNGRGAIGEDAGAQSEHVGELLTKWAVGAEPAHFADRSDGPECVGDAGHVDRDVAGTKGQSAAPDLDGGLAGDHPFD